MVMELGKARGHSLGALGSTRWTSTVPTPFGPAPGAGRLGEVYNSGFAATRDGAVIETEPGQAQYVEMRPEQLFAQTPFTVVEGPKKEGEIPSIVARLLFTERGALTQEILDRNVLRPLRDAKFKTSRKSTFKSVRVRWKWGQMGAEASGDVPLYVPEVAEGPYKGLRYVGPKFMEPLYEPDSQALSRMPPVIWVYSLAATSANRTMTDGEAAQVLTVLKQGVANTAGERYGAFLSNTLIIRRTCPAALFRGPSAQPTQAGAAAVGWSALLLLVAYNMVSSHVGSEVV